MVAVSRLSRLVPNRERDELVLDLLDSLDTHDNEPAGAIPDRTQDTTSAEPRWEPVWHNLLLASALLQHTGRQFRDPRLRVDLSTLETETSHLSHQVSDAYELVCHAPRIPGLQAGHGEDLQTLRHAVDLRRAEIVDAELADATEHSMTRSSSTWSVDYREHGGFVATTHDGGDHGPHRMWGYAPTARSAAKAITDYFRDNPPTVEFCPPAPERPWVRASPRADLSLEGPRVTDLLEARGPAYDEHLAACATLRDTVRDHNLDAWLRERAEQLNTHHPQLSTADRIDEIGSPDNHDHRSATTDTVQWVPTRMVVATACRTWGDFGGHRPTVPLDITQALATTQDLESFTQRLFSDEIGLTRIPGWAGPIYRVSINGTHRVHLARMLDLPWLAAAVQATTIAPAHNMLGLLSGDPGPRRRAPLEKRAQTRLALIQGLLRRGIIDADLDQNDDHQWPILRNRRIPAPWLLRDADTATTVNAVYERCYPGALAQLGIPDSVGTDPQAWTKWLTT